MQIYVLIDSQPQGPYTPEDVRKYLKSGQLRPEELGAYAGSADWKPLREMVQSWGAAAPAVPRGKPKGSKKSALWLVAGAIILVVSLAVTLFVVRAHRRSAIQGAWEGVLELASGVKLRVVNHISATNGSYRATCDCIELRQKDIPIEKFVYDYPSVEFESKGAGGSFTGKLNGTNDEISGTWTQDGASAAVIWKRTATPDAVPELLSESDYTPRSGSVLQGCWRGTLQTGSASLRVVFKIAESVDGKFVAELDSLDQGANNVVVSSVTYDKRKVRMEVGGIGGAFEGKTSSNGGKLTGTWQQGGMSFPLALTRTDPKAVALEAEKDFSHASPDDLPGHWKGLLQIQSVKLHLVFNLAKLHDGSFSSTVESPDQGPGEIPANSTQFTPPKVIIELKAIGGVFKGALKNGKLSGTWQQGGMSHPLVLSRD